MKASTSQLAGRRRRSGTTMVELAMILPVFLTFVFGLLEYGRIQMVSNVLKNACRQGARYGATEGVTTADAMARVNEILSSAVNPSVVDVILKDATAFEGGSEGAPETQTQYEGLPSLELSDTAPRQLFLVRASVSYNDIALVPFPNLGNMLLSGQAFMRHE